MKIKQLLGILIAVALMFSSVLLAASGLEPTFSSSKRAIIVTAQKPEFTITLQSNPSTGYSWFLGQYDAHVITPASHRYVSSKSDIVGAPGFSLWTFKVNPSAFSVPQTTKITLKYARPWDNQTVKTAVFTVRVVK